MRVSKSSPVRVILLAVVSLSLIFSLSFSLRLASVSANPVKPAPPPASFEPQSGDHQDDVPESRRILSGRH